VITAARFAGHARCHERRAAGATMTLFRSPSRRSFVTLASRLVAAAHLLGVLLVAAPAAAAIAPPHPLAPLQAAYPEGAAGAAEVVVELTVDTGGRVEGAHAVEGPEPFATAAVTASATWRFEPATQEGTPVRARIRVQIHFKPAAAPSPDAEPPPPGAAVAPPVAPPVAAGGAPLEVVVLGAPRAPGAITLSGAEVRVLPGAFGDAFRALEALPGVTPILSGLPYFYVRGAPPGNVGYFIDDIRVPALFHVLAGPGIVPGALIQSTELYPGGYPAQYGRFTGGIVAAETRAPQSGFHAEGVLRLIDAGAVVEAPLPGGLGSALAGARYSYTAPILSLFVKTLRFDYWDYQARVVLDLTPRDRLTIFAFGSHDDLEQQESGGVWTPTYAAEFHRVTVRYDARVGEATSLRQSLTFGVDRSVVSVPDNQFESPTAHDTSFAARTQVTHRASPAVLVRAGADATLDAYTVDQSTNRSFDASLFPARQDIAVGLFADAVINAGHGVEVTPGVRVDLWGSQGTTAISGDVRLAARVPVTSRVRLLQAAGLAHQAPGFVIPVPGVAIGGLSGGLQRSVQTSAGVEADLPLAITASATFFYNAFFNLNDVLGSFSANVTGFNFGNASWLNQRTPGSAVGMEIYVRRKLTEQLGGYLSYTLSRSTRYLDVGAFPSVYDRTHVLGGALSWQIGRGFRVGARGTFYTGAPGAPSYIASQDSSYSGQRLPPYFRLDVRAEKRWTIATRGWLAVVLEGQNVTLAKEPAGLYCPPGFAHQTAPPCSVNEIGPVTLPSLGLEGGL
jgi:TonB family protein